MSKLHGRENDTVAVEAAAPKSDVALREESILDFWREHDIFHKTLEKEAPHGEFIFYDGPPFATGLPHYGHILAGTIKDAIPRFWTMNGYHVPRKWGWDCHGLPLENLIEKKLGLATKRDIEEYGVQNFNEAARDTVMEYADDWRRIIPRMGRFVDMDDDYKTMDSTYTESVWWVLKTLDEKGYVFEGFKSMHLCPRCGTTLSNFEVNQGYKDIKDIAVTVKLPLLDEAGQPTDTALLVWTTTPWTLPGNMAAAVHEDFEYVKVRVSSLRGDEAIQEYVILAKGRLAQLGTDEYEIVETVKGADLVGRSYEPPFPYFKDREFENKANAWKVYHADYVELGEEGTGAVHLAPAYGEEDLELAKRAGIPIVHHVNADGHFEDFITDFAGQLVKPKDDDESGASHLDADIEIVKALNASGKLFKKENITHSYPHCWRCDTPLLNYATTSWFVDVPQIKEKLVAENSDVHWVPEHVGRARFGKWLEGARDWAVSRQRYWGAPLPIWKHPKTGEYKIFGSLNELQAHTPKSGNTYLLMRHGESDKNVEPRIVTNQPDAPYHLTEKGKKQVCDSAAALKDQVDLIVTSPVLRAKETAELVADTLGLADDTILVDERIREIEHGVYEGKPLEEFYADFPVNLDRFEAKPEGGENWNDIRRRMGEFLYDLEARYQGKRILIVSHGDPMTLLNAVARGAEAEDIVASWEESYQQKGVVTNLDFIPVPHNDNYELDFHRPYIDHFVVCDENGDRLERIPDVFDCWFESGSMPYGQQHYLGQPLPTFNPETEKGFPAQFIAEGLDQTRGWFYSLIVLGTALFGKSPYENVIVNGLVLAEDGKKMSKSLQNYPDPMELADRVGVDAMRMYLLSSPVIRAEDLNFSEKEVLELQRKNIGRLHNVLTMYQMYADGTPVTAVSDNVLDRWIVARLNELVAETTAGYKNYELDKATRPLTDFIDDLSVWYLRRSRDRLKGEDVADKQLALGTLRFVLTELAKVMAPVMPFYAEYLYREIRDEKDPESVHLCDWPEAMTVEVDVLTEMAATREVVTQALEARTKAGIKVRQPVASVTGPKLGAAMQQIVLDEVNAKSYQAGEAVAIDTTITPELQAEGDARELMRAIQDMRKKACLEPNDRIALTIQASDGGEAVVQQFAADIKKTVGADTITLGDADGQEVAAGQHSFTIALERVS